MDRHTLEPRTGWQSTIEQQGLVYWRTPLPDGSEISYWSEDAYYSLTYPEVYEFEGTVRALMDMLVEAGDYIIDNRLYWRMGIPGWMVPRIVETWNSEPPMLYGRFDFAYARDQVPKLLEYNADTPTALMETAVQWYWMRDHFGEGGDQWNSVHEALVARWREMAEAHRLPGDQVHILHTSAERSGEDFMTTAYMAETLREAGLRSRLLPIEQVGFVPSAGFVDDEGEQIRTAFKLYPWEWMAHERFATEALDRMGSGRGQTTWIEPVWKMLWSNKGILPVLWHLYPGHPNLLPAFFEEHDDDGVHLVTPEGERVPDLEEYVHKPLLAREGANATIVHGGEPVAHGPDQDYGEEGFVVQQYADLGDYGGGRPVMGVWTVDMEPVGLGIREQDGLITDNYSRFAPHVVTD